MMLAESAELYPQDLLLGFVDAVPVPGGWVVILAILV
jgi:hypothetical protein